jgi:hypothetical protein
MHIDGVTVCLDYSDFLAETLPLNIRQCDRFVVVTAPEDLATQRVCDFYNVDVVLTDVFQSRWGEFHKAKGINAGLDWLAADAGFAGWVLHLDADIVLAPRTKTLLDHANLPKDVLHGADRVSVPNAQAWAAFKALPVSQHDGYHVSLEPFKVMPRFNAWHLGGYAPPGYFQLWHPHTTGVTRYPDEHSNGDKTDVLHCAQWERARRALLPEVYVYHLESEPAEQGTNWGGRVTKRFGAEPSHPESRRHRHQPHHHHHHRPYERG